MTIPTFASGQILTADALNSALQDVADTVPETANTFTELQTFEAGIAVADSVVLDGTTAGTITSSMPERGAYKKFAAYASGYENDTTTALTISFPVAFDNTPTVTTNEPGLTLSASTTGLTITAPDSTTAYSGLIIVEGF